jgi:hypothetical protein
LKQHCLLSAQVNVGGRRSLAQQPWDGRTWYPSWWPEYMASFGGASGTPAAEQPTDPAAATDVPVAEPFDDASGTPVAEQPTDPAAATDVPVTEQPDTPAAEKPTDPAAATDVPVTEQPDVPPEESAGWGLPVVAPASCDMSYTELIASGECHQSRGVKTVCSSRCSYNLV